MDFQILIFLFSVLSIWFFQRWIFNIKRKKRHLEVILKEENNRYLLLSYILNNKIKVLKLGLIDSHNNPIKIGAKIYDRNLDDFKNIYSELIFFEKYNMN